MIPSYTPTENPDHPEFLPTVDMEGLVTSYQAWSESVAWADEANVYSSQNLSPMWIA